MVGAFGAESVAAAVPRPVAQASESRNSEIRSDARVIRIEPVAPVLRIVVMNVPPSTTRQRCSVFIDFSRRVMVGLSWHPRNDLVAKSQTIGHETKFFGLRPPNFSDRITVRAGGTDLTTAGMRRWTGIGAAFTCAHGHPNRTRSPVVSAWLACSQGPGGRNASRSSPKPCPAAECRKTPVLAACYNRMFVAPV